MGFLFAFFGCMVFWKADWIEHNRWHGRYGAGVMIIVHYGDIELSRETEEVQDT